MITSLALAVCLFAAPAGRAEDGSPAPAAGVADRPSPELVKLDRLLTSKQKDRDQGRLPPDEYRRFAGEFRAGLDRTAASLPPTAPNVSLRAALLARLGDSGQALKALDRALAGDPRNPRLIEAKGYVLLDRNDYAGAAAAARAALQGDPGSLGAQWLKHAAEDRAPAVGLPGSPWSGAAPEAAAGTVAGSAAPRRDDARLPFKPEFHGVDKRIDVPGASPADSPSPAGNSFPLWPLTLPLGAGLAGYGVYRGKQAYSSEDGLNPAPDVPPEVAARNRRVTAIVAATGLVVLGAVELGPPVLSYLAAAAGPSAPAALTPAFAGAGGAGAAAGAGALALDQAAIGTLKAGLLAGGAYAGAKAISQAKVGPDLSGYSFANSEEDENNRLRGRDSKRRHDRGGKLRDEDFRRWFHRHWKQPGDADATQEALDEAYQEWLKQGRPKP